MTTIKRLSLNTSLKRGGCGPPWRHLTALSQTALWLRAGHHFRCAWAQAAKLLGEGWCSQEQRFLKSWMIWTQWQRLTTEYVFWHRNFRLLKEVGRKQLKKNYTEVADNKQVAEWWSSWSKDAGDDKVLRDFKGRLDKAMEEKSIER